MKRRKLSEVFKIQISKYATKTSEFKIMKTMKKINK